jgi:hypothetical protein
LGIAGPRLQCWGGPAWCLRRASTCDLRATPGVVHRRRLMMSPGDHCHPTEPNHQQRPASASHRPQQTCGDRPASGKYQLGKVFGLEWAWRPVLPPLAQAQPQPPRCISALPDRSPKPTHSTLVVTRLPWHVGVLTIPVRPRLAQRGRESRPQAPLTGFDEEGARHARHRHIITGPEGWVSVVRLGRLTPTLVPYSATGPFASKALLQNEESRGSAANTRVRL